MCSACGRTHDSDSNINGDFICPDCNQNHLLMMNQILQKDKIINHIMAYCNVINLMLKSSVKLGI